MENSFIFFIGQFYISITWLYPVILPLFLAWLLFRKKILREEMVNFLSAINLSLGIAAMIFILAYAYGFLITDDTSWNSDGGVIVVHGIVISIKTFYLITGFVLLLQLLLLFYKFRMLWVTSLTVLSVMHWGLVLNLARQVSGLEVLPDFASPFSWQQRMVHAIIFVSAVFLSYWGLAFSEKLPYASAWLKMQRRKPRV